MSTKGRTILRFVTTIVHPSTHQSIRPPIGPSITGMVDSRSPGSPPLPPLQLISLSAACVSQPRHGRSKHSEGARERAMLPSHQQERNQIVFYSRVTSVSLANSCSRASVLVWSGLVRSVTGRQAQLFHSLLFFGCLFRCER